MNLRQTGLVMILLAGLLGIAAQWANLAWAANLWTLPLALLLLGLAYERHVCAHAGLRLSIQAPEAWHLAARTLTVRVAPCLPEGLDATIEVRTMQVPAAPGAVLALPAVSRRLGELHWPVQAARVAGPLGLAWWSVGLEGTGHSTVVPAMLDLNESVMGAALAGARLSHVVGPGAHVEQLRDYRPGDPLRVIDWRATARRRQLVSRDFAEDQHLDVVIALDVGRSSKIQCGALDRFGHYVNGAARIAQHVVAQDDRIGLVVFGDQPLAVAPPTRGHAGVMRVREVLASLRSQNTESNAIHAASQVLRRVHQRSLVVLLTDIDDASSEGQLIAALRLLQPRHLPFVVGLSQLDPGAIADQAPRDWLDPWLSLAAAHNLTLRERGIRALRATGAQVALTTPADFERTLFEQYSRFRQRRRI
jgi:uncharacterized protein (DUF58 family)